MPGAGRPRPSPSSPSLFKGKALFWVVAVVGVVLDVWTKYWAFDYVERHSPHGSLHVEVIPGFFHLVHVTNTGTIFGLGQSWTPALVALRVAALAVLLLFLAWTPVAQRLQVLALGLIFAGAMGNLYDNFFSPGGGVRDFLLFYLLGNWRWPFPAFNVADSCICVGAGLLVLGLVRGRPSGCPARAP